MIPGDRECDQGSSSRRPTAVELCEQMNDVLVAEAVWPEMYEET